MRSQSNFQIICGIRKSSIIKNCNGCNGLKLQPGRFGLDIGEKRQYDSVTDCLGWL